MSDSHKFDIVSRQSNQFIESPFAQEFSEHELKTMEFIISQTKKSDLELARNNQVKVMSLSIKEFAMMIGAHPDDIYRRAKDLSESLMNKKIRFGFVDNNGDNAFVKHSFFTSMSYQEGRLTIGINPFVLPYFVDISSHYTEFRLENILRIGSSYGIKLYKLLKQYENTAQKYRDFLISEIRSQFGIPDDKYDRYNNFKSVVIETAIKHINNHTDIQVKYKEFKLGRKVHKLRFFIKSKLTQHEQAKIFFEAFMNKLSDNDKLKHMWDLYSKNKKRLEHFQPVFNKWIDLACRNYIPMSTDSLIVETEDDLLFEHSSLVNDLYSVYISCCTKK